MSNVFVNFRLQDLLLRYVSLHCNLLMIQTYISVLFNFNRHQQRLQLAAAAVVVVAEEEEAVVVQVQVQAIMPWRKQRNK